MMGEMNMIHIPERLLPHDIIGIVAPASPFDLNKFKEGVKLIESMGFQVDIPDRLFNSNGYLSASDTDRAEQINRYFGDKRIKAILCARGGYGSIRVLSSLDFETIQKNPKIFIGFSDITVLLTAFYGKCGFPVFHGPMVTTLPDSDQDSQAALKDILTFSGSLKLPLDICEIEQSGKVRSPVGGGNLTSLCHLMGTAYGMDFNGHILFLEDRGEALYRIDRMLTHLKLAGCFNNIKGLILGSFEACGKYRDVVDLAKEIVQRDDIPVISGFGAGHGRRNMSIPIGLPAMLDTDKRVLIFHRDVNT